MNQLIYVIKPEDHTEERLKGILEKHREIKFVSLMGVDLGGNATDEKIPISLFLKDIDGFLKSGVQTDGSSVVLPGIATLNNAKVDIVPDLDVNWFIDYNYELMDENHRPCGTLRIPSFLVHNGQRVDSRSILYRALDNFEKNILQVLKNNPKILENIGIDKFEDIEKLNFTAATELEFWVKTPEDKEDEEKLSTSQTLKEQYWKRTQGTVRTALEESMLLLEKYGLGPEMGHKEVGGVNSTIGIDGKQKHVMEQLEIDWKYSTAVQAADNEILAREMIGDVFRSYGLEVTFAAKPIEGVAGSGEHTHMGISVTLKDGSIKNLFAPKNLSDDYMSIIGYGALMGILHNYEVISPFVTSTNDGFNRLKPGFEAPVCTVASLGHNVETPSRNRSILIGLIRDMENPLATRFELRAPNPLSNTYLVLASCYQGMIDGIIAFKDVTDPKVLYKEISKKSGEPGLYLERERQYRAEDNIFEDYTEEERNKLFGKPPATVWENVKGFTLYKDKTAMLLKGGVFSEELIKSFKLAIIKQWKEELLHRIIPAYIEIVRECKQLHEIETSSDLDVVRWKKICDIKYTIMKDSMDKKSLTTRIREALLNKDYDLASDLQLQLACVIKELKELYICYKRNIF
ncbi:glutamine synthetase [Anaerobranca californiensis DSM 14826]|uniref:glutamine synthetase n=1 Tax=Anaerobranca californiensis DSM 14826 TaxID=1120989 RepID=A0A1M6QEJ1_9FIRM|nr:glutamine synthetase [Anaerobranca californiensis]SHK18487.1 glutamine synthetase [Anaerobranca californiensis DSM 14826]